MYVSLTSLLVVLGASLTNGARIEKSGSGHILSPYDVTEAGIIIRRDVFTKWGDKVINFSTDTCGEHRNGHLDDIFMENAGTNIGRTIGELEMLYYHGFVTEENVERSPRIPFSFLMDHDGNIQLQTYPSTTNTPPKIMVQLIIKNPNIHPGSVSGWYINAASPSTCNYATAWRINDVKGIKVQQQTITNLPPSSSNKKNANTQ